MLDPQQLDQIADKRRFLGLPALAPDRLQEIAAEHPLKDDPSFDMVVYLSYAALAE